MKIVKNVASVIMVACAILCIVSGFIMFGNAGTLTLSQLTPLPQENSKIVLETFTNSAIVFATCALTGTLCRNVCNAKQ